MSWVWNQLCEYYVGSVLAKAFKALPIWLDNSISSWFYISKGHCSSINWLIQTTPKVSCTIFSECSKRIKYQRKYHCTWDARATNALRKKIFCVLILVRPELLTGIIIVCLLPTSFGLNWMKHKISNTRFSNQFLSFCDANR